MLKFDKISGDPEYIAKITYEGLSDDGRSAESVTIKLKKADVLRLFDWLFASFQFLLGR